MDKKLTKKITKEEVRRALIKTVPNMTGYVVLGFGYGMIMQSIGFGVLWSLGMSLFLYTGTMQFVAIGLFTGGASLLTTAVTTLAVSARHLFYGISMIDRYKNARRKPFLIFALTALFVSIFVDQWMATKDHAPAVFGVVLSVLALLLIGPDSFLIPAMILITVALTLMRKRIDGKEASDE